MKKFWMILVVVLVLAGMVLSMLSTFRGGVRPQATDTTAETETAGSSETQAAEQCVQAFLKDLGQGDPQAAYAQCSENVQDGLGLKDSHVRFLDSLKDASDAQRKSALELQQFQLKAQFSTWSIVNSEEKDADTVYVTADIRGRTADNISSAIENAGLDKKLEEWQDKNIDHLNQVYTDEGEEAMTKLIEEEYQKLVLEAGKEAVQAAPTEEGALRFTVSKQDDAWKITAIQGASA